MVKSKFKVDEVVMALDKANVYEAKILKVQSLDNISKYFIHYNGWARKYDCWIEEGHLARKNADKDLAKLDELAKGYFKIGSKSVTQAQEEFISSLQKGSNKSSSSSSSSKSSKRKSAEAFDGSEGTNSEIPDESEEGASSTKSRKKSRSTKSEEAQQLEVIRKRKALLQSDLVDDDDDDPDLVSKIQLPAGLKRLLLDDWKAITKNPRKLVLLPVKPNLTVAAIINDFLEKNSKSQELTEYRAFFHGLKIQFNKSLPSILLFRQERDQFDKILEQCTEENYCDVYGAHHLLRFYVRLPRLLSHIVMAPRDLNRILSNLTDLLRFLDKNIERYHNSEDYVPANDALDHLHSATFAISK